MGILDKTSNFILNQTTASIYGAFHQSFDQTEFERDREDGVRFCGHEHYGDARICL